MKTTPALRWACYAIAAAATAAAMWQVDHRADEGTVQAVRPAQRGLGLPVADKRSMLSPDALAIYKQRLDAALSGSADPFSDNRPAAAAAAAPAAAPAAAEASTAAPVAPAMPYSYVGRWRDKGSTEVFLQAGGRVFSVRAPGPLESGYAVESIGPESLTIKGAGGDRHVLSFAAADAAPTGDASPSPGRSAQTAAASAPAGASEEN